MSAIIITHTHTCLPFAELDEKTKGKVLENYRDYNTDGFDWWNWTYEGFAEQCLEKGIEVDLEENYDKKQQYFDNMFNFKDTECQDEQFDGFKSDWEISQYLSFNKPDNIKHVIGATFKTKDDKTLKVVPTFYLDGKLLTEKQLEKLGITIHLAHTRESNIQ